MLRHCYAWIGWTGLLLAFIRTAAAEEVATAPLMPTIRGDWWTVAGDPDLGPLTKPEQQVVDFAVWQAGDGTWQIWSCIRNTKEPGKTRLFHRWEGQRLTDTDWKPMGIAMQADEKLGEMGGGLQAPFVIRRDKDFYMVYGDWVNICSAESQDGKKFNRRLRADDKPAMFSNGDAALNTRDPMILRIGDLWHCYYTAHPDRKGSVYCRTSKDLVTWSDSSVVAVGGAAGTGPYTGECPFVVEAEPGHFYLFRTQHYPDKPMTRVYHSTDPMKFGIDEDAKYLVGELPVAAPEIIRDGKEYYVAALLPTLKGIRIARLDWVRKKP